MNIADFNEKFEIKEVKIDESNYDFQVYSKDNNDFITSLRLYFPVDKINELKRQWPSITISIENTKKSTKNAIYCLF
jgi:hypothetical protein